MFLKLVVVLAVFILLFFIVKAIISIASQPAGAEESLEDLLKGKEKADNIIEKFKSKVNKKNEE
jgi:flagellar biosynthesis/type III secretory pathway M-ring protein FliF/YscJ